MIMQVLRCFPGYTLSTVQDVPYCHFLELFSMADSIDSLNALTMVTADGAKYDKDALAALQQVERAKFKSKDTFKRIVTESAKKRVEKFAKQ
jgi:hypothetical protein